jgi:transglutaminase-like putative cysteine protease
MDPQGYKISFSKLLLNLAFLVLPTIFIMFLVIGRANDFFSVINRDYVTQTFYFGAGVTIAYILYVYRVRFIITFPLLLFILYLLYKSIEKYYPGEFDSFFVSIRFMLLSIVFTLGWLVGFGLARFRNFPLLLCVLMLAVHVIMLSATNEIVFAKLLKDFLPIILYAFYIMYAQSVLYSLHEVNRRRIGALLLRLSLFVALLYGLFEFTQWKLGGTPWYKSLEAEIGAMGGQNGKNMEDDLLNKQKNQTFSMKDYAELRSQLGRTDELLFCSYVNNFFEGTDYPNPLYFTCYYLTRYDVQKERFETDPKMPSNDLFQPDPTQIPLFFTKTDSTVIKNGRGDKLRKVIDVDVYINKLSPNTFVSPSVAFSCQPITVEDDFKETFRSAYRTRCYVSELNSAYFVYNANQPQIQTFQQQRYGVLDQIKDYKGVESSFIKYYTDIPAGATYDSIRTLTKEITKGANTPIEKILKVRDFFLSKSDNGEPLFTYTLTPGNPNDPNIPNASKLNYFLFKNRKGYCTYFAGATLFMLRSAGLPTRMTVGFMTVDRSDKNKGWYWFYGDQAHAWVQVYFPGYGWLDFDTTIGAEESRESPKPDGTPPIQPPKAWLAASGTIVEKGDSISKSATFALEQMVYHDAELKPSEEHELKLDLKNAIIKDNAGNRSFKDLHAGDQVLVVSYDEKLKKLGPYKKGQSVDQLVERFPNPVPIDEVHIKPKEEKKKEQEEQKQNTAAADKLSAKAFLWLLVLLIFPLLPLLTFMIMRMRANSAKEPRARAYRIYRLSEFLHHQLGYPREDQTPLEFAEDVIDKQFNSGYTTFMRVYLKTKYANLPLNEYDVKTMDNYYPAFIKRVFAKFSRGRIFLRFIDFTSVITFWTRG